jgi:hypothetical protein
MPQSVRLPRSIRLLWRRRRRRRTVMTEGAKVKSKVQRP